MFKKIGAFMTFLSKNKGVVTRIILFVVVWLNQLLVAQGMQPIPYLDEETVSGFLTLVISIYVLIKDNKMVRPEQPEPTEE